jgi:hypothetical protein
MYYNEDCGLHHSLEWDKLAPTGNGPRTLNAANTNPNWTGSLASAQAWQISEFKRKSFPCWIWKSILVHCGPWMINDSRNTVVLRKPHVCNWQFRDDTWIQVTHSRLHYFIISQITHILTIFFPELWFRKYQNDHTASLLLTEITQIKFCFKPHCGTKSGGLTTYQQLHMRVSISCLKPQWAEVYQIPLPLYSGLWG